MAWYEENACDYIFGFQGNSGLQARVEDAAGPMLLRHAASEHDKARACVDFEHRPKSWERERCFIASIEVSFQETRSGHLTQATDIRYCVTLLKGDAPLTVWVFGLLEVNGRDVRALPLEERRHYLQQELASRPGDGTLRYSESFHDPARLLAAAHDLGLEGVVSKRLDAPSRSGMRPEWIKVKTESWRIANRERWRLFEKPPRQ